MSDSQQSPYSGKPVVSVLIPTYNRAPLLRNAIDCVLAQTYSNYEIVVVDDGSTDNTAEVVDGYAAVHGKQRIRYIYQQNQKISAALNTGLANAHGKWSAVLASDDLWVPEKLERQVGCLQVFGEECGACFTDSKFMNRADLTQTAFELAGKHYEKAMGLIGDPVLFILNYPHGVFVQALMMRTDLALEVGGFDPKLYLAEDHDFLFRLAIRTKFSFVNAPLVTVDAKRGRSVGLSELAKIEHVRLEQYQYRFEKWLSLSNDLDPRIRRTIQNNLSRIYNEWANFYLTRGDYAKARQAYKVAAEYRSTPRILFKWLLCRLAPRLAGEMALKRLYDPSTISTVNQPQGAVVRK